MTERESEATDVQDELDELNDDQLEQVAGGRKSTESASRKYITQNTGGG